MGERGASTAVLVVAVILIIVSLVDILLGLILSLMFNDSPYFLIFGFSPLSSGLVTLVAGGLLIYHAKKRTAAPAVVLVVAVILIIVSLVDILLSWTLIGFLYSLVIGFPRLSSGLVTLAGGLLIYHAKKRTAAPAVVPSPVRPVTEPSETPKTAAKTIVAEQEIKKLVAELSKYVEYLNKLEVMKASGQISDEIYDQLKNEYIKEIEKIKIKLENLKE